MGKRYRDARWEFELELPDGWRRAGFFRRLLNKNKGAPEFFGPQNDSIKFAIGPIAPVPECREQMEDLRRIATMHGHEVLAVGSIAVDGKQHATMVVGIPVGGGFTLRLKNYSLICGGIEYFVTATIESGEAAIDAIIQTFKKI